MMESSNIVFFNSEVFTDLNNLDLADNWYMDAELNNLSITDNLSGVFPTLMEDTSSPVCGTSRQVSNASSEVSNSSSEYSNFEDVIELWCTCDGSALVRDCLFAPDAPVINADIAQQFDRLSFEMTRCDYCRSIDEEYLRVIVPSHTSLMPTPVVTPVVAPVVTPMVTPVVTSVMTVLPSPTYNTMSSPTSDYGNSESRSSTPPQVEDIFSSSNPSPESNVCSDDDVDILSVLDDVKYTTTSRNDHDYSSATVFTTAAGTFSKQAYWNSSIPPPTRRGVPASSRSSIGAGGSGSIPPPTRGKGPRGPTPYARKNNGAYVSAHVVMMRPDQEWSETASAPQSPSPMTYTKRPVASNPSSPLVDSRRQNKFRKTANGRVTKPRGRKAFLPARLGPGEKADSVLREVHNELERQRRKGLQQQLQRLSEQVCSEKRPKLQILAGARATIMSLEAKMARFEKELREEKRYERELNARLHRALACLSQSNSRA